MFKHHEYELMNRLERVHTVGTTEIRHDELKLWYKMERLGVSVWRDIQDRWEGIVEAHDPTQEGPERTLLVGPGDGDFVFIYGVGLAVTDGSWFKDVRSLARRDPGTVEEGEDA